MYLPMNLQYFAEEPNDEQQPAAEPQKPDSDDDNKPQQQQDKMIPYDRFKQVNDKAKQFESAFKELGIDDVDALKNLVTDYQAKKEAEEKRQREEMSEIEKLQADLKAKEEAEQTYRQQLEEYQEKIRKQTIHNEFIKQAQAANIAYIDDALKLADLTAVKVNEDGKVEGVAEAVSSLIENKPFLLAQAKQPKDVGKPTNNNMSEEVKTLESQLEEAKKEKNFSKVIEISNLIKKKFS